jgi:hypothetical protein
MGIFDDAIRQHLDLKLRQGADEDELQQLEDEAFGPPARPGEPDFPETGESAATGDEPAAPATGESASATAEEPIAPVVEPSDEAAPHGDALLADPDAKPEAPPADEGPVEDTGADSFSTTEREAIADQPTEMYDIEEELSISQAAAPSEEELVEKEIDEPRLAPVDPLAGLDEEAKDEAEDEEYEEDDDFWDEKRLSDELDQALEAPSEVEEEEAIFEPASEEESDAEEPRPAAREEDVLEETPDFLEEAPEDDELWFEQKPPKDFDFDD